MTHSLLQGLRNGNVGAGASVDVSDWFKFAEEQVPILARGIGGDQKPMRSVPRGETFPIGLLNPERREQIPLSNKVPVLLRAVATNDGIDTERLGGALNERFLRTRQPLARGGFAQSIPSLVYVEDSNDNPDDIPEAIKPIILYSVEGDQLIVRLRLRTRREWWREQTFKGPRSVEEMSSRVVDYIIAALKDWK